MSEHLTDTATVWSAVAALWALSAAWFTYKASVKASQQNTFQALQNLTVGIRKELELISLWAGPEEDAPGYQNSKTREEYFREMADWQHPERVIYSFEYPTIKGLSSSQYVRYLEPIIADFITLNYSVVRLFDYYREYRQFVISQTALRQSVNKKLEQAGIALLSPDETWFLERVFLYNYTIHVKLIGGSDSKDERCLYASFRRARRSLESFGQGLRHEKTPWWYRVIDVASGLFVLGGLFLFAQWVRCVWAGR